MTTDDEARQVWGYTLVFLIALIASAGVGGFVATMFAWQDIQRERAAMAKDMEEIQRDLARTSQALDAELRKSLR